MIRHAPVILLLTFVAARAQTISVAAAVSLREAVTAAAEDFQKAGGPVVDFAFGGSGPLLAQIRSGAPIDLYISAGVREMDQLQTDGLLADGTRRNIASNDLVLIADPHASLTSISQLAGARVLHIGMGNPKTVPAGLYAEQTLQALRLYDAVATKIIFGSNVRQVLDYVRTGNVDAGFVYATDASQAGDSVRVVASIDPKLHEPIVYPAAILARSEHAAEARRFLNFLGSAAAMNEFTRRGFQPPDGTKAATRP